MRAFSVQIFLCLSIGIGGCAGRPAENYKSISVPALETTVTAEIGDSLLEQGYGYERPVLIFEEDQEIDGVIFRKGRYRSIAENRNFVRYAVNADLLDGSKAKDQTIRVSKVDKLLCYSNNNCIDRKYRIDAIASKEGKNSFQQTLIYSGKIGTKITVGYREFIGGSARPAFSNEVSYDLSESSVIGYKGVRLEVIKVTNTDITYKVVSNFENQPR